MANLVSHRLTRAFGALLMLVGLSACVGPQHRGYYAGGGYGRSYAAYQPVYRGGYGHGGYQRHWR